ncbi:hypothetical protein RJ639_033600 [Escallonia herrerae]|uniref:Agenet domain-containing protein n=1 Tax=Escallonia herrerae TaxID=1293975 RepID=A0AA88X298_9ASTE|nr:hypothetical protein RJ639_033600 [Escallonia herrerae]
MGGATAIATARHKLNQLPKNSQVEVSPDEDGFRGSWYVATVLDRPSSRKKSPYYRKVRVQYHTLLADEDGSKPLKEHVSVDLIRPCPPLDVDLGREFELNDVVDAFYRDGWWTGVISRVVADRFLVSFSNPPDEIEFAASDLRLHREWVDGRWLRPDKQRTAGLLFSAGKKVEVFFDGEEPCNVWFPATVLEDLGNGSFLVNRSPGAGDGTSKVIVDSLHIRPSPPLLKNKTFDLLEKVDAFYDFGWWSGVITKELADSRYVVFFKHTNKEKELNYAEIRPHMEWKDGKWFSTSQDILSLPDYHGHRGLACKSTNMTEMAGNSGAKNGNSKEILCPLNSRENQIEQSNGNENESNSMSSLEKKTTQTIDADLNHLRPLKKLKEGNFVVAPSHVACHLNTTPNEMPSQPFCGLASPTIGDTGINSPVPPVVGDESSARTYSFSQGKRARSKRQIVVGLRASTSPLRRGRPTKVEEHSPSASAGAKKSEAAGDTAEHLVEEESGSKEPVVPVIVGADCNGMGASEAAKTNQPPANGSPELSTDRKQKFDDQIKHNVKEINQLEVKGQIIQKRGRGRPRKMPVKSPEDSVHKALAKVNYQNREVAAVETVVKECVTNEVGSHKIAVLESTRLECSVPAEEHIKLTGGDKKISIGPLEQKNELSDLRKMLRAKNDNPPNINVVQVSSKKNQKLPSKRGRRRTISLNTASPGQDSQDAFGGKTVEVLEKYSTVNQEEMGIEKLPVTMSDDQPLSTWFEGMHTPTSGDGSSKTSLLLSRTLEKCAGVSENQEIVIRSPTGDEGLPFTKNTPLWRTVESMEVFRIMPQKPHFRPLDCCKVSSREGLAIGTMVTFSSLVEKASHLQLEDPRGVIEESLEALLELESHGFDVKVVRDRLTELLLIKDKHEQLQDQSKHLRHRVTEHKLEKSKIDLEIRDIDMQIEELHKKRALALSKKAAKDSEIASVALTVEGINEVVRSARLEFEGLVASPW